MQIVQVRFFFLTITFILSRAKSVKLHAQGFLAGADTGILKRVGRGGGGAGGWCKGGPTMVG